MGSVGGHDGIACALGVLLLVGEHQLAPRLAHVPLDVVGEHAQEDVGADAIFAPVVDRPDLEVDGLEGAEGAFHAGQRLVVADRIVGGHVTLFDTGANDVETIERGFLGDLVVAQREVEAGLADRQLEVLGDLLNTLPTRTPMAAAPRSVPRPTMARTLSSWAVVASISAVRLWARRRARAGLRQATRRSPG